MSPEPQYRPLLLDEKITFTLPAVEACVFMAWAMQTIINTDAVDHIFSKYLGPQFEEQLYIPASIKAARASYEDRKDQAVRETSEQITKLFGGIFSADGLVTSNITVVCDTCGRMDHYDKLPFGELTCGHDGPRHGITEV